MKEMFPLSLFEKKGDLLEICFPSAGMNLIFVIRLMNNYRDHDRAPPCSSNRKKNKEGEEDSKES